MLPPINLSLTPHQSLEVSHLRTQLDKLKDPAEYRTWSGDETGEILAFLVDALLNTKRHELGRATAFNTLLKYTLELENQASNTLNTPNVSPEQIDECNQRTKQHQS